MPRNFRNVKAKKKKTREKKWKPQNLSDNQTKKKEKEVARFRIQYLLQSSTFLAIAGNQFVKSTNPFEII